MDQWHMVDGTGTRMRVCAVQPRTDLAVAAVEGRPSTHTPVGNARVVVEEGVVNGGENDGENTPAAQMLRTRPDAR